MNNLSKRIITYCFIILNISFNYQYSFFAVLLIVILFLSLKESTLIYEIFKKIFLLFIANFTITYLSIFC